MYRILISDYFKIQKYRFCNQVTSDEDPFWDETEEEIWRKYGWKITDNIDSVQVTGKREMICPRPNKGSANMGKGKEKRYNKEIKKLWKYSNFFLLENLSLFNCLLGSIINHNYQWTQNELKSTKIKSRNCSTFRGMKLYHEFEATFLRLRMICECHQLIKIELTYAFTKNEAGISIIYL